MLRPYQEQALHDVGEHFNAGARSVCLVSPTGCHAIGTSILRRDGMTVAVEHVSVGDLLMGPDSEPRRVLHLIRGHGEMFRVTPVKGESFTATREHVLTLVRTNTGDDRRGGELIDVTLDEWLAWPNHRKHIHKLIRTGVYFPKQHDPLPLDPYFLGVLLGDGSLRYTVGISKPDQAVVDLCSQEAARHGLYVSTTGTGTSVTHNLCRVNGGTRRNPIIAKLVSLGLRDTDSGTKFVPHSYLVASRFQRLSILAGLIDTDGSLSHSGFDFISKSERLSRDVAFLARSVGLAAYVTECRKGCQTGAVGTYYRVYISGDASIVPCRIPRKQAPARTQIKDVLRTGFSVEQIDDANFYGFTLDGDGRYLLGDFTITHNSGKTRMGVAWLTGDSGIHGAPMRHSDAGLWVVHRVELAQQTLEHLEHALPGDVGIIGPRTNPNPDGRVQVATIQTLLARGERPDARRIVADECHHFPAGNDWSALLASYPDAKILGLTATPERRDGRPLGDIFEQLVVGARYPELVELGHLVGCRAFAPRAAVTDGVANDPVAMYRQHGEGGSGFLFADTIPNAEMWAEKFSEAGTPAVAVHQKTPARDRRRILNAFAAGQIRLLMNVYLFVEGTDVPTARVCILARPVSHVGNFLQMAGRILRPSPGKTDAILIDLCGSVLEHGLPTRDREYSLEGRAISSGVASVRQCPQCGAVHDGAPSVCDLCGYEFGTEPGPEKPPPRIYDEELRQVYDGDATPDDAKRKEFDRLISVATSKDYSLSWVVKQFVRLFTDPPTEWLADLPEDVRRKEYDQLAAFGAERGYKPGFPAARYKETFGAWPPRSWKQGVAQAPPPRKSPGFMAWLTENYVLDATVKTCIDQGCLRQALGSADRSVSEATVLLGHLRDDHDAPEWVEAWVHNSIENYKQEFIPGYVATPADTGRAVLRTEFIDEDVPF